MRKMKLLLVLIALFLGTTASWAQKDVTSQYITNATLSNGTTGWTNENFNTPVRGNNTVGYASECYAGWGSLEKTSYSLTQKITLPAGHYTLVNYSFFRYGLNADTDASKSLAFLKAGNDQVAVKTLGSITAAGYANSQAEGANAFDSKMYRNALDFTIDANNTEIEIGLYGTFDLKQSWMICGMFELINNDIAATMDAPFDVTGYITNPGFEYRDMTGWTLNGDFGAQGNNQTFKVGGYYAEKWQPSSSGALGARSMSQTLTNLPAGFYKLTANLGGDGTYIDLNGKTANWETDKDYTVGYVLAENEDLVITAGKTAEGTANWIHFDNFRLQFCGDVAAALTTLCAEVTNYENQLSASDYATLLSAVNGYNKSYSDVDELLAAIDAVQALYESADLYIEYTTALDAANAIDQETPMNGDVLSALQTAIATTTVTMESSAAEKVDATNALNTATSNANISIANYAEAKGILDAANNYDAAGQASYAADETIAAIQAAYDDRTLTAVTAEQKAAAQAALDTACKAQIQPADGCDMTAYIVNPDFNSGNFEGWTRETPYGGNCNIQGGSRMEYWAGNSTNRALASFDIYQELTSLPAGVYTISADMYNSLNDEGGDYTVFSPTCGVYGSSSNEEVALVTEEGTTLKTYTTGEVLVFSGHLRIGTKNTITPMAARWFLFDNVKLTYARQLTPEEIAANKVPESILLDPTSVDMTIYGSQTITATIMPEDATDKSITWTSNNPAVATVENGVVTAVGIGNAIITASANGADNVIATATITVTDVTPVAAPTFYSEIADGDFYILNAATGKFLGGANDWGTHASLIEHGIPFTVALADGKYTLDSHTYESDVKHFFNGTYIDAVSTDLYIVSKGEGKYSISTADGSQFVSAKPGITVVDNTVADANSVLAQWYFISKSDRDKMLVAATEENPADATYYIKEANFSRNWGTTGKNISAWTGDHTKGGNNDNMNAMVQNAVADVYQIIENIPNGTYKLSVQAVTSGTAKFYANDVEREIESKDDVTSQVIASDAFGAGFFKRDLTVTVKNQTLKVGVKSDDTDKTLYFDNFELFMTSYIPFIINEDNTYDTDLEGVGDVTLTRTIKANIWNTFVVPFDIDNDELKAKFGDDVAVAEYSEVANGEYSTVKFQTMDTPAITANTPVLLKTSTAGTSYEFTDKQINKADEAKVEGTNYDFVGTYAASTTIAEGDFFIANDKLWKSNGNTTIKGTRAYFKAKHPGARIAEFSIGEGETTGISTIATQKEDNAAYDMQGRRVETLKKGVYVVNGKKVVVK